MALLAWRIRACRVNGMEVFVRGQGREALLLEREGFCSARSRGLNVSLSAMGWPFRRLAMVGPAMLAGLKWGWLIGRVQFS